MIIVKDAVIGIPAIGEFVFIVVCIMNIENRRLREVQQEKHLYSNLLAKAETISESLLYQGKLDSLEKEEKEILDRYGVKV